MPDIYVSGKKEDSRQKRPDKAPTARHRHPRSRFGRPPGGLSAYVTHPAGVHFEGQEKDEEIELFLRRHPITNVPWILVAILMILAPLLLYLFPFLEFLPTRFQFVSVLIWYLLTAAFVLENFLKWHFNIYIVTKRRIVDIDFYNLVYKEVTDANLDRVQEVTYRMAGVVRTLFNYGDVFIQTAGATPNFEFLAVPNPDDVVKTLQELRRGGGKGNV